MSLILKNVSKKFDNFDDYILKDINLEIKDKEFVCVIGHSGCGKSTLLNIIAGLEKPTKGEIYLDENPITKPGKDRIVMFQESSLFPWLNVIENVKFGMNIAGISKEEQEEKAVKYLKLVQLLKFKDYRIHELSGGMRQRVELARALTLDSKVLLMDEPFASLDKQTINMLRKEIQNIWLQTRKTVLFITHSVEEALFFADRIIMISSIEKGIKKIFNIDIERPRHIESKEFIDLRVNILNEFKQEVKRLNKKNMIKSKLICKIFFPLILIGLWFIIYFLAVDVFRFWKPYAFPNPIDTFKILVELCRKNLLISAVFQSMKRIFIGYSVSIFVGGIVGFLIYKFFVFNQIFKPFILGLQSMPSICWVPFAILWFGLGESSIIFVIVMGSLFSVATTFESSIKNVKPLYIKAAKTMGISEKNLFFKVIIPASIPSIVTGMKQSWAFAWRALLSAEVMSATIGLGQLLIMGRNLADINQVVLIMIIIVLIGILFDRLIFSNIEKRVLRKNGML